MEFGSANVDLVSDGTLLMDGGSLFGQVPKSVWESQVKPDRKNRVRLGLNCLLIRTPEANILIDTGAGSKRLEKFKDLYGFAGNRLIKNLKRFGISVRDIDVVVLTSLRFHSAGGSTKVDRSGNGIPVFPKAKHMVQMASWQEALNPNERLSHYIYENDFIPLESAGLLELLDGDHEIISGVRTMVADGPCAGHQVVLIEIGGEKIAFSGGLVPTHYHLPLPSISSFDRAPDQTLEQKKKFLEMAVQGGWLVVFSQGVETKAGYMEERKGATHLMPIDL